MNEEWLRAGKILGGIGAGMTGQTQQWDQNNLLEKQYAQDEQLRQQQAQQQAKLAEMERLKTQYKDSVPALKYAKSGDWDSLIKLGESRQQLLKNHPTADNKDTVYLTQLAHKARAGDQQAGAELKAVLEENVRIGTDLEIIKAPVDKPVRVKSSEILPGGIVVEVDDEGNYNAKRVLSDEQLKAHQGDAKNNGSAKTEMYANGTVVMAMPQGIPKVYSPSGEQVFGKDALKAITAANAHAIKQKGMEAGAAAAAQQAITISNESYEKLEKLRPSIANLDEAIRAVDAGASTGALTRYLPTFRDSTKALESVANRMGLDVVAGSSFGALSESELNIAMATALPDNMGPGQLREWLVARRAAQSKMLDYLQDTAIFLGVPGNTPAKWLEVQKGKTYEVDF